MTAPDPHEGRVREDPDPLRDDEGRDEVIATRLDIHDTRLTIRTGLAPDRRVRRRVFLPLVRAMRRFGWRLEFPAGAHPRGREIIVARRGSLIAHFERDAREIEIDFDGDLVRPLDPSRPYRRDAMAYLAERTVELTIRRILALLRALGPVSITADPRFHPEIRERPYIEDFIARGAPGWNCADGPVADGAVVWTRDAKGRAVRGPAFRLGRDCLVFAERSRGILVACAAVTRRPPADLRRRANDRLRRDRLEDLIAQANAAWDFARAAELRRVLGADIRFVVWSRSTGRFFGPGNRRERMEVYAAGRFTREEATAFVEARPADLVAWDAAGERIERIAA